MVAARKSDESKPAAQKSPKLASTVHVDGVAYGPGDDVPADVAKQITNPKAWAGPDAEPDGATVA